MTSTRDDRSSASVAEQRPEPQASDNSASALPLTFCNSRISRSVVNQEAYLADLPREVRDMISELIVFHQESNGVIAPIPTNDQCYTREKTATTVIGGKRFNATGGKISGVNEGFVGLSTKSSAYRKHQKRTRELRATANSKHKHICTTACLLQPALAQVSRAFRAEALPMFYAMNHFHIELSNFRVCNTRNDFDNVVGPVDWWRAVGDTNLRYIRHLEIVGKWTGTKEVSDFPGDNLVEHRYQTVSYVRDGTDIAHGVISTAPTSPVSHASQVIERRVDYEDMCDRLTEISSFLKRGIQFVDNRHQSSEVLAPFFRAIEENGLHVQALECVVAYMEEKDACILRDYSALDSAEPMVKIIRTCIENKLRLMEKASMCIKWFPLVISDRPFHAEKPKKSVRKLDPLQRDHSGA